MSKKFDKLSQEEFDRLKDIYFCTPQKEFTSAKYGMCGTTAYSLFGRRDGEHKKYDSDNRSIESIASDKGLSVDKIKSLLFEFTLTEISNGEWKDGEFTPKDIVKYFQ